MVRRSERSRLPRSRVGDPQYAKAVTARITGLCVSAARALAASVAVLGAVLITGSVARASEAETKNPDLHTVAKADERPSPRRDARSTALAWAQAWSEQAVDEYLRHYSESFLPEGRADRKTWEQERRERITRPARIRVTLENIQITVFRDRTEVTFDQRYDSESYSDQVGKKLVLVWEGDRFMIHQESTLSVAD